MCFHVRSEEHTSELQSHLNLVCRLLLEKKKYRAFDTRCTSRHSISHSHVLYAQQICQPYTHFHSMNALRCFIAPRHFILFFFFNDTATTEIYTLSLHDALPI